MFVYKFVYFLLQNQSKLISSLTSQIPILHQLYMELTPEYYSMVLGISIILNSLVHFLYNLNFEANQHKSLHKQIRNFPSSFPSPVYYDLLRCFQFCLLKIRKHIKTRQFTKLHFRLLQSAVLLKFTEYDSLFTQSVISVI